MNTVKSFKGYGKPDEAEERTFHRNSRNRCLIIIVASVVLIGVLIGAIAGTLIRGRNSDDSKSSSGVGSVSVKSLCDVTPYPATCVASILSFTNHTALDPEQLFKLTVRAALDEATKVSTLPARLVTDSTEPSLKSAIQVCSTVFNSMVDSLNDSLSRMETRPGESDILSASKIGDITTWISSVVSDHETCLDALLDLNSTLVEVVRSETRNVTKLTSNSLALVSKILGILAKFDVPLHRRLLWSYPDWVGQEGRRILSGEAAVADFRVAKDGSGTHRTIMEAIETVPKKSDRKTVIHVKGGVYNESVIIDKNKWNVVMYGDGMGKTIVTGNKNFVDGVPTFMTATFAVMGRGFIAKDMSFVNTAGPEKHQAVAFRSGSDMSVYYKCSFDAFQDTLYAHSNRQFYRECDVTGTIDFIFGDSTVVFQSCNIMPRQPLLNQFNTITAQGKKDPLENTGISMLSCKFYPFGNLTAPTYLGRPWKNYATTVIIGSSIDGFLNRLGWTPWTNGVLPPDTIYYGEYKNTGVGADLTDRVNWTGYYPRMTEENALKYTVKTFIMGEEWLPNSQVTFQMSL